MLLTRRNTERVTGPNLLDRPSPALRAARAGRHDPGLAQRVFFFSRRRRHTRCLSDWSSDVCSSDLGQRDQTGGPVCPFQLWVTGFHNPGNKYCSTPCSRMKCSAKSRELSTATDSSTLVPEPCMSPPAMPATWPSKPLMAPPSCPPSSLDCVSTAFDSNCSSRVSAYTALVIAAATTNVANSQRRGHKRAASRRALTEGVVMLAHHFTVPHGLDGQCHLQSALRCDQHEQRAQPPSVAIGDVERANQVALTQVITGRHRTDERGKHDRISRHALQLRRHGDPQAHQDHGDERPEI